MIKEGDIVGICRKDGRNKEYIVGRLMEIIKIDRREKKKLKYPRFCVRILTGKEWYNNIYNSHYYIIRKEAGNTEKIWKKFEEDAIALSVAKKL